MTCRTFIRQGLAFMTVVGAFIACGGSNADPILNGAASSSGTTSGTSGGTDSGSGCENVKCAPCPPNTRGVSTPGQCCARCEAIVDECAGVADSCQNKKACSKDQERFEYAPGCCDCRLTECSKATCAPFNGCQPDEHVNLAGCCASCVKNAACQNESLPCSSFVCPVGYKAKGVPADGPECCSSCEPDANCTEQRKAFDTWLAARLAQPGARDCQTKDDCEVANLSNKCQGSCGTAVAKTQSSTIVNDTKKYGDDHCASCAPIPIGCPGVVLNVRCTQEKKCALGPG